MRFYRDHVLPWILDKGSNAPGIRDPRGRLLRQAAGQVIEIGFGAGRSLEGYRFGDGGVVSVAAVEPHPGMLRRGKDRLARSPVPVRILDARAESIPADDRSFDCAVSVLTLCGLDDVHRGLAELHRVLRPGGAFLFLDHGRGDTERLVRWQRRLNPIQKRLAGCRLDVAVAEEVVAAGFTIESLDRFAVRPSNPLAQMYVGTARRGPRPD